MIPCHSKKKKVYKMFLCLIFVVLSKLLHIGTLLPLKSLGTQIKWVFLLKNIWFDLHTKLTLFAVLYGWTIMKCWLSSNSFSPVSLMFDYGFPTYSSLVWKKTGLFLFFLLIYLCFYEFFFLTRIRRKIQKNNQNTKCEFGNKIRQQS